MVAKKNNDKKQITNHVDVKELRECMKCHYFWGNDNRCVNSNCIKKEKPKKKVEITECTDCPYKQNSGYCFPCMKKLLEKKAVNDVTKNQEIY